MINFIYIYIYCIICIYHLVFTWETHVYRGFLINKEGFWGFFVSVKKIWDAGPPFHPISLLPQHQPSKGKNVPNVLLFPARLG